MSGRTHSCWGKGERRVGGFALGARVREWESRSWGEGEGEGGTRSWGDGVRWEDSRWLALGTRVSRASGKSEITFFCLNPLNC